MLESLVNWTKVGGVQWLGHGFSLLEVFSVFGGPVLVGSLLSLSIRNTTVGIRDAVEELVPQSVELCLLLPVKCRKGLLQTSIILVLMTGGSSDNHVLWCKMTNTCVTG